MAAMHATWGKKWVDQVAGCAYEAVRAQWGEALAKWTKADARDALAYCRDRMAWPPSIAEFIQARKSGSTPEQRSLYAMCAEENAKQEALTHKQREDSRARIAAEIAKVRKILAAG